jgi:hypothetical protein
MKNGMIAVPQKSPNQMIKYFNSEGLAAQPPTPLSFDTLNPPAEAADGTLIYSVHNEIVYIKPNGAIRAKFKVKGWETQHTPAILKDGTVAFGDMEGNYYFTDLDGNVKASTQVKSEDRMTGRSVALPDGRVAVGTNGNDLHIFEIGAKPTSTERKLVEVPCPDSALGGATDNWNSNGPH